MHSPSTFPTEIGVAQGEFRGAEFMALKITVDSMQVQALFARLRELVANPRSALVEIGNRILGVARQSFESQASPEGAPWVALNLKYAAWKQKRFPGRNILQRHGALLRTLFSQVEEKSVTVGSPPIYSGIHQFGGRAGRRLAALIPARPFLPGVALAEQIAVETLEEHIEQAINP